MLPDKREKIKFYIVMGLAFILVTSAYFRFWHKKGTLAHDSIIAKPSQEELAAEGITTDKRPDDPVVDRGADVSLPPLKRDIFRPRRLTATVARSTGKQRGATSKPTPNPTLKLSGTIVGGGEPIAIINDRFVRTGDSIDQFRVVRIGKNEVQLVSGNYKIELKMIDNE